MDLADLAQTQNMVLDAVLQKQRKPEGPKANGRCLNCNEKVADGKKFCDLECSEDYEYRMKQRRLGR